MMGLVPVISYRHSRVGENHEVLSEANPKATA